MTVIATTKLEAVNECLGTIGQQPVNSLSANPGTDVSIATKLVDSVSRELQTRGWHFNTEKDYVLTPNTDDEIVLPANVASVDIPLPPSGSLGVGDVVQRGNKLYDRVNHTFTFTAQVKADIVWMFEFEELPETARRYVAMKAARLFEARALGDTVKARSATVEEQQALAKLQNDEHRNGDPSMLNGGGARFIARRGVLRSIRPR